MPSDRSARARCINERSHAISDTTKKPIPTFRTEEEAEDFVANADLAEYDLAGDFVTFRRSRHEETINVNLPGQLLKDARARAERAGMPLQKSIRMAIEKALEGPRRV